MHANNPYRLERGMKSLNLTIKGVVQVVYDHNISCKSEQH